ncbi:uncharacterized protein [Aegilops tauschii subsp. strangulata]|uniref:uncharacterized protein n=1 Tax=Aegilops tauschii subsp. strangulata TaxID=200361 RepID=UPI003CC8AACC
MRALFWPEKWAEPAYSPEFCGFACFAGSARVALMLLRKIALCAAPLPLLPTPPPSPSSSPPDPRRRRRHPPPPPPRPHPLPIPAGPHLLSRGQWGAPWGVDSSEPAGVVAVVHHHRHRTAALSPSLPAPTLSHPYRPPPSPNHLLSRGQWIRPLGGRFLRAVGLQGRSGAAHPPSVHRWRRPRRLLLAVGCKDRCCGGQILLERLFSRFCCAIMHLQDGLPIGYTCEKRMTHVKLLGAQGMFISLPQVYWDLFVIYIRCTSFQI